MARVVRTEVRKRGFFGQVVKVVFILFNLAMIVLMVATCSSVHQVASQSQGSGAGAALGGAMLGGTIMFFWALGTIILGALVMFTRGDKVVTERTIPD